MKLDIVVTGVGGQGNVLASQVLGRAFLEAGYQVTVGETYGLSQRGGAVLSQVRVSRERVLGPAIPENGADAIVGLEPMESLRVMSQYGNPQVTVITNNRPINPQNVIAGQEKYPDSDQLREAIGGLCRRLLWLPATQTALELGAPILANVFLLGALVGSGLLPLELGQLEAALAQMFPEDRMPPNRLALARGMELAKAA